MGDFGNLWNQAVAAGNAAATKATPPVMVVSQHENPLDDNSPVVQQWVVPEGPCGFAWVSFKGNTPFGRWAKATGRASKGYPTGLQYWVSGFGQSVDRKAAFASAFAEVLRAAGIQAYSQSRLD